MIVSHEHRYIFLKTRKTAGTSTEIALSRSCGPRDIITPISPEDEVMRRAGGGPGPQNYDLPLRMYSARNVARLVVKRRKTTAFNHMSAAAIRRLVGEETWNSYYKFAIVRNPWDMVLSQYYWRYSDDDRPPLSEAIESDVMLPLVNNRGVYSIDGEIVADRLLRFENLAEELEEVRRHVGISEPLEMPRAKGGTRTDKRPYRDVFTPEQAELVRARFSQQTNPLGYHF